MIDVGVRGWGTLLNCHVYFQALATMVQSKKLSDIIALGKSEICYTKSLDDTYMISNDTH